MLAHPFLCAHNLDFQVSPTEKALCQNLTIVFQFAYELPYLKLVRIQFQSKGGTTVLCTLYLNRATLIMKTV